MADSARQYFAYGSNMCAHQMRRRRPRSRIVGSVAVARWRCHSRAGYVMLMPAAGFPPEDVAELASGAGKRR